MRFILASGHRFLTALLLTVAMNSAAWSQDSQDYIEGEVIVRFKSTATVSDAEAALQKKSLQFQKRFRTISSIRRKQMGLVRGAGRKTQDLIRELKTDPAVETVEPNYRRWISTAPNDTRFGEQWALNNTAQTYTDEDGNPFVGTAGTDTRFLQAWEKARPSSSEIVVAVIDTGVFYAHPDLAARMWTNSAEIPGNNIDDDGNGYRDDYRGYNFGDGLPDPVDSEDHGTHVAGTIAAQGNNSAGITGVNDRVKIMPLRIEDEAGVMSTSSAIEATEYAITMKQRGVPLVAINASYGGGSFSQIERDAIAAAGAAGIVFCAASGNAGKNVDSSPVYPAAYDVATIISVAASDPKDGLASFSNFGTSNVDIAAPGVFILSTLPTLDLQIGSTTYVTAGLEYSGKTTGLSGKIYNCGIGNTGQFPAGVRGNIALIERGTLTFADKVRNAKTAGAIAAIIYNNVAGLFEGGTLGTSGDWIPSRAISREDGLIIRAMTIPTASLVPGGGYGLKDGTSMAAPHVTGAVAFAALNFPDDTVTQRIQRILANVDVKPAFQGKVRTGGRLNLNRIVDSNQDGVPDWQTLRFTTASTLKGGVLGIAYDQAIASSSGVAPVSYAVSAGTLPSGLTLAANGQISGIPEAAGTFSFTIQATDAEGALATRVFTLVIAATAPQITSGPSLPEGSTGAPYSQTLSATGGTAPYQWSLNSGSLPAGLSLSNTGIFTGLSDTVRTVTFTVRITDAYQLVTEKELTVVFAASPITITSSSALPYTVKAEVYAQTLSAEGGLPPYTWTRIEGVLPTGITLSPTGQLTGKTSVPGNYQVRIQVKDANDTLALITSKLFTLQVQAAYTAPVVNPLALGSTFVGASYSATVTATDYPKSFSIKGLPKGLTYSTKTGAITGRPSVAGNFTVSVLALNPARKSTVHDEANGAKTAVLTVRALDAEWSGAFAGIISRSSDSNKNLGSRFVLTITTLGSYSLKVITGGTTRSVKGYIQEDSPQISTTIDGQLLTLILDTDEATQRISGLHGTATVTGWRNPWSTKLKPATVYEGYYSAALNLNEPSLDGLVNIPQGTGYLTLRISKAGIVTVAGKTALGESMTSSAGLGLNGEALVYQSLYKHKGSLFGDLAVQLDTLPDINENGVSGTASWMKPLDTSRSYGAGFEDFPLSLSGGFLALSPSGKIARGLPRTGDASLLFTDGGLADASINPDIVPFQFSDIYKVTLPKAGEAGNPGRATLAINKASGVVTGKFSLHEDATIPVLKRTVSFYGMIIPQASGSVKAQGYFLLPQIPATGQKSTTSPILSGGMKISQPEVQN